MGRRFSLGEIETMKANLESIPPAAKESREVSLGETIRSLSPTIRRLVARGHSRDQIVAFLNEQGVPASLSTLRAYFRLKPPGRGSTGAAPASSTTPHEPGASNGPSAGRASTLSRPMGSTVPETMSSPRPMPTEPSLHPQAEAGSKVGAPAAPVRVTAKAS